MLLCVYSHREIDVTIYFIHLTALPREGRGQSLHQVRMLGDSLCHEEPMLSESTFPVKPSGWISWGALPIGKEADYVHIGLASGQVHLILKNKRHTHIHHYFMSFPFFLALILLFNSLIVQFFFLLFFLLATYWLFVTPFLMTLLCSVLNYSIPLVSSFYFFMSFSLRVPTFL